MAISRERWQSIEAEYDALLDSLTADRSRHLRALAEKDPALYQDLVRLMQYEAATSPIDGSALELIDALNPVLPPPPSSPARDWSGTTLGAYRLIEPIGSGGMGVVYRAERQRGDFQQEVAIKILSHASAETKRRFQLEQQALAKLKHPNITQLHDGGISEQGDPYLVMEFVRGAPLLEYCQRHRLSFAAKLELLKHIMSAVAYSHAHFMVHRDLKPSNIMVTDEGLVKLLDFGIVKLIGAVPDWQSTHTQGYWMTPSFCAPEQLTNKPITVATDVYQLGLVAYQLLTGHPAVDTQVTSLDRLLESVCRQDVIRPSARVASAGCAHCAESPAKLRGLLRGDVDAIIMRMLRKDPADRYESMSSVQADWQAYMDDRPVSARAPDLGYHLSKALRRHRSAFMLAGLILVAGAGYLITIIQHNQAISAALAKSEIERRTADQVTEFLASTFQAADPNVGGLEGTTAAQLLERGRAMIESDLRGAPEIQARILNVFAEIYYRQNDFETAHQLYDRYFTTHPTGSANASDTARAKTYYALQKIALGDADNAVTLLESSLMLQQFLDYPDPVLRGETLAALASATLSTRQLAMAAEHAQHAITVLTPVDSDPARRKLAYALEIDADIHFIEHRLDQALGQMRASLDNSRAALGNQHSEYAHSLLNYSRMLLDNDELDIARQHAQDSLRIIESRLPADHPYAVAALALLAKIEQRANKISAAEALIGRALAISQTDFLDFRQIDNRFIQITILLDAGKLQEASELLDETLQFVRERYPDSPVPIQFSMVQARLWLLQGRFQEALDELATLRQALEHNPLFAAFVDLDRAAALLYLNRAEEATQVLTTVISSLAVRYAQEHSTMAMINALLEVARASAASAGQASGAQLAALSEPTGYNPAHLRPLLLNRPAQ